MHVVLQTVGIIEPMVLPQSHDLVKKYNVQKELEKDTGIPIMEAQVWLRALDFWSAHHEKQIENESLDWSSK